MKNGIFIEMNILPILPSSLLHIYSYYILILSKYI
jgi:hypothetical protein